jgi:hypothetical protein
MNAATRSHVCFAKAEEFFFLGEKSTATACYLEGLRILLEESTAIPPLEYLQLAVIEQHILVTYIIPESPPCSPLS